MSEETNEKIVSGIIIVACVGAFLFVVIRAINLCINSPDRHWFYWEESSIWAYGIFNLALLITGGFRKSSWLSVFNEVRSGFLVGVFFFLPSFTLLILAYLALTRGDVKQHLLWLWCMSFGFSILDAIIFKLAKERKKFKIYDQFGKNFWFGDVPTFVAFGLLLSVYVIYVEPLHILSGKLKLVYYEYLIGGAVAFQLIASIVIFLVISLGGNRMPAPSCYNSYFGRKT